MMSTPVGLHIHKDNVGQVVLEYNGKPYTYVLLSNDRFGEVERMKVVCAAVRNLIYVQDNFYWDDNVIQAAHADLRKAIKELDQCLLHV